MSRKLNPMEEQELRKQFVKGAQMLSMQLPEVNTFSFLMGMSELSEKPHRETFLKNIKNISKYFLVSSLAGIITNRLFTKSKFLPNNFFLRFVGRSVFFFLPNLAFSNIYMNSLNQNNLILRDYNLRLFKFRKTNDIRYYDPNDIIFKQFVKQLTEFNPGM